MTTWKGHSMRIGMVVGVVAALALPGGAGFLAASEAERTPLGVTPGAPAGSYPLSDLDRINLYSGNLSFHLPLLSVMGRGEARTSVGVTIDTTWGTEYTDNPTPIAFPRYDYWRGVPPGYSPGTLMIYRDTDGELGPGGPPAWWLTRLTFTMADHTQYEFRDVVSEGAIGGLGFNRGNVFKTYDGSAITLVLDANVVEGQAFPPVTGNLHFPDGVMYRIEDSLVRWLRDRNGNRIDFEYNDPAVSYRVTKIRDSLLRETTIAYSPSWETITFKGFGGATRSITVFYADLAGALDEDFDTDPQLRRLSVLFPGIPWGFPDQVQNPRVVSQVTLPDNRFYSFRYNHHAELVKVTLPTGGELRYEHAGGVTASTLAIYRRVEEKATYREDGASAALTRFNYNDDGSADTRTDVEHLAPDTKALLSTEKHYFYGRANTDLLPAPLSYPHWRDGREHKTETYEGSSVLLKTVTHVWEQRINPPIPPPTPAYDPRITSTTTSLAASPAAKVSQVSFEYDLYNNPTVIRERDFGAGAPGALLRKRVKSYVTTNEGADYTAPGIHLRRLPLLEQVFDQEAGTAKVETAYDYDQYTSPGDTLVERPDATGHLGGTFGSDYHHRGNVTAVRRKLTGGAAEEGLEVSTRRRYDVLGNMYYEQLPNGSGTYTAFDFADRFGCPNGEARATTQPGQLGGLKTYAFASAVGRPLSHTIYRQYDYYLGQPVDEEDVNGVVSSTFYGGNNDPLDRPRRHIRANNHQNTASCTPSGPTFPDVRAETLITYDDSNRRIVTETDLNAFGDHALEAETLYDGLGRLLEERTHGTGGTIFRLRGYDAYSRPFDLSNPYRSGDTVRWTTTTYDALGRVLVVKAPGQAETETSYAANVATVTDPEGKVRATTTDGLGRVTQVVDDPQNVNEQTSYGYDVQDNLVTVTQTDLTGTPPVTQARTFTYDSLGRLRSATNPESGLVQYKRYDGNGNLLKRTDARLIDTSYTYDALDRVKTRTYTLPNGTPEGTPTVTLTYDVDPLPGDGHPSYALGRLSSVSNAVATMSYDLYDAAGRLLKSRQIVAPSEFASSYTYDRAGHLTSQRYPPSVAFPAGRLVLTEYDTMGRIAAVSQAGQPFADTFVYAPHGAVQSMRLGNDLREQATFTKQLQPETISVRTSGGTTDLLKLDYGYGVSAAEADASNNGNIRSQKISIGAASLTQSYGYDSRNRLQTASEVGLVGHPNWSQTYGYDRFGNRAVTAGVVPDPVQTPNAPGDFNKQTNRFSLTYSAQVAYDPAGNLTRDARNWSLTYDAESRQTSLTTPAGATTYSYDGEGRRIRRTGPGTSTLFIYDGMGRLIADEGGPGPHLTTFTTPDAFGTPRLITRLDGSVGARLDYFPFGEAIPTTFGGRSDIEGFGADTGLRQKFTGKERDTESGFDYFGMRYGSAAQGRFTGADPGGAGAEVGVPQSWHGYAYALNNPLKYVDPDGAKPAPTGNWLRRALAGPELAQQIDDAELRGQQDAAKVTASVYLAAAAGPSLLANARFLVASPGAAFRAGWAGLLSYFASPQGQQAVNTVADTLSPVPLAYGPWAGGALGRFADSTGGRLLDEVGLPAAGQGWAQFSFQTLEGQLAQGGKVLFDLTHVKDLPGLLRGTGPWADAVTSQELRYLRDNWKRFKDNVTFYRDMNKVPPPW
jgi:RHS repeat-associated protein